MENLVKLPYEISLWDDRLTLVTEDGRELSGFVNSEEKIVGQYYKEHKLCVIGSNTMESSFGVVDPSLVRKTDGTSTLTFSMYARYYDEDSGEFKDNPFIKYLTNERKVKLKYYPNGELRWLDFIIKKIDESSENYKFSYTATDLFINELSKTGYNLEFDMELENNQGTVVELADKILARSDWTVGADNETLQETKEEPLYRIKLDSNLVAKDIFTHEPFEIVAGAETGQHKYIYTFYSTLYEETDPEFFQFIYDGKIESEGKISHVVDENNVLQNVKYLYCARTDIPEEKEYYPGFRGQKYIRSQKNEYDKALEEYVKVYENKKGNKVYGYTKTEYFTPSLVTTYITNGHNILSATGWDQEQDGTVGVEMYPLAGQALEKGENRKFGIQYKQFDENDGVAKNGYLLNSGFRDNAESIKEIAPNHKFAFGIKVKKVNGMSLEPLQQDERFNITVYRPILDKEGKPTEKRHVLFEGAADNGPISVEGEIDRYYYYAKNLIPNYTVSYDELTDITREDKFYIEIKASKDGTYHIQQVELFAQHDGKIFEKDEEGNVVWTYCGIILPSGNLLVEYAINSKGQISEPPTPYISNGIAESEIKTTYYYYLESETREKDKGGEGKTAPEEVNYLYIGEVEQKEAYKPAYDYTYEKVRSISKKETNRFDLLQTLSENFKCWCRFDVWHKDTGEIMLAKDYHELIVGGNALSTEKTIYLGGTSYSMEDLTFIMNSEEPTDFGYGPYQQLKFVTFHNKIGQKKNIGFRYGTNLKSISRSLDSNTIATKLIVKSNTNEFANGGSCNIALAKENPSGENFIYDFTYYINQGLMSEENLERDLYYQGKTPDEQHGWIGLYVTLKALNKERDALIAELTSCTTRHSHSKSAFENAKLIKNASEEELERLRDKYHDITGDSYDEETGTISKEFEGSNEVKGIVYNIELYVSKIKQTESDYSKAKEELKDLDDRIETISDALEEIENQTADLISKFETKYIRFIQEASWTSEDYIDDNLYYLDAETTLHKSAQPKVSYTINVIELSQLEEYKNYVFDLGDITYIQDPDFFGWKQGEKFKTPHKEEIVITEMQTFFHSPEKSTIKVQNYRSSFDDLFKKLTASAQSIQFHSGEFQRAADIVDAKGNIAPSCLEDAFSNNKTVLQNAGNQSVKWDETGITTTDTTKQAEITRITSGGIFLTDNGGEKWTTGITAKGINASTITTGVLNTGFVNIYNGNQKSFTWDSQGINAYKQEVGKYDINKFVRFNQHGLFGTKNWDSDQTTEKNIENSSFYLGWDGLNLREGVIQMDDGANRVQIDPFGKLKKEGEEDFEVFSITSKGNEVFSVNNKGTGTFKGDLYAGDGKFKIEGNTLNFDNAFVVNESGAKIGNWLIEYPLYPSDTVSLIYKPPADLGNANSYGVGMATSTFLGDPAFWAGLSGWNNPWKKPTGDSTNWESHCKFYVKHNGDLFASNANITGNITAKSLVIEKDATVSGTIRGVNIELGGSAFGVTSGGYLTSTSGQIGGWYIGSKELRSTATDTEVGNYTARFSPSHTVDMTAGVSNDDNIFTNNLYTGPVLLLSDHSGGTDGKSYSIYITTKGLVYKIEKGVDREEYYRLSWQSLFGGIMQ